MFASIYNDLKRNVQSGNMVTKIIMFNVVLYVVVQLIGSFTNLAGSESGIYRTLVNNLALPASPSTLITQPWSIITHMFFHVGFWHILWNMLLLYWFGRIVGDFLGDERILPMYLLGGFLGAVVYILTDLTMLNGSGGLSIAYGASAAVLCIIFVAATLSPDYIMSLLLIGPVKIKFIALGILIMDLIGIGGQVNSGGHFAHLGGAFMGMFIVYMLRQGRDLTAPFVNTYKSIKTRFEEDKQAKSYEPKLELVHVNKHAKKNPESAIKVDFQEKLDEILDKIKEVGIENLSDEEKEFLNEASKKD